jgi:uncharacterized protein
MLGKLNPDQIEQVLRSQEVGRIGCHAGGTVYVVPITYLYDEGYIYAHTRLNLIPAERPPGRNH